MMFDIQLESKSGEITFSRMTLRDIVFSPLPHRNETCKVIYSHLGDEFITISLSELRYITFVLSERLKTIGLKTGDTLMLASFSSTNELANALIFTAAACTGIRVFVPIFPEPSEFDNWKEKTGFKCIMMPFHEIFRKKGFDREKEVIATLQEKCEKSHIQFLDSFIDFSVNELIKEACGNHSIVLPVEKGTGEISPETEAVIFTTSGTSGISKLLVYSHRAFADCCQAWEKNDLFRKDLFGNPGFSPLFTHTIGIRTFINCVWSGSPSCILVTDWFLSKPEIVRYLLLKMNIGHFISGPAFYNTMLELFRQYPELKTGITQSLQAAISIGAPYDETTAQKFKSATGVIMMNALGTTETLMVTLNMPENSEHYVSESLGRLLPGVTIGLKQITDESIYELSVKSAFQSVRTIGEVKQSDFFETGDLIRYDESTGNLFFCRRRSGDFIKDEYGVKIPLDALRNYYRDIYDVASWIEWIPLVNIPGLAALIFLPQEEHDIKLKDLSAQVKSINEGLKRSIEPFEYSHRHLERISVIYEKVPLTRKGTVSKDQIFKRYDPVISELRNPFVYSQFIELTETGDRSNLYKFSNPVMAVLLEALRMDKVYTKGEGDYLYHSEGETLHRTTDFVGGFGANLLGHNHPKIRQAIDTFLDSGYPALNNQGSQYYYPSLLARELNRLFSKATGKYFKVQFGNSGAEAAEIAIHHAYYEWRLKIEKLRDEQLQLYGSVSGVNGAELWDRNMLLFEETTPCILSVKDCFHGYTSAARSLLGQKKARYLFSGLLRLRSLHIDDNEKDLESIVTQLVHNNAIELQVLKMQDGACTSEPMKVTTIIASIIEPVRGEGGICVINQSLVEILSGHDFPLISDEIQCGLGRTGDLPSCKSASYYLLGKSLGGGLEKISAVLIDDQRFKPAFTKYFNSTFANGEMAAFCGLAMLKVIEEEGLTEKACIKGEKFLSMLLEVASRFPDVIESVRGKGLMIGIRFNPKLGTENIIFRILFENELSGYLFAGWLLNNHNIRVLPSLSGPNSIRIEPSFYLPEVEMTKFCDALEELCRLCSGKKLYDLCKFLMNGDPYPDKMNPVLMGSFPKVLETPAKGSIKAGFIGNFTLPHLELQVIEPDFLKASDTGLRILFNRLQILLEGKPIKIMSKNLLNDKVHFTFYILPFDTSQMEVVSRWGKKRFYIARIQEAVNTLTKEGAECISLGAHTSIITGNGLNIAERGSCKVLTGNTLTVASCLFHLNKYLERPDRQLDKPVTIAIVGASGNIGSGLVDCLDDPKYREYEIILAGNNEKRLQKQKDRLSGLNSHITCTTNLFELKHADIIICCVNTNDPVIFPHHIHGENPVIIIDISVPCAVSWKVGQMENVQFCNDASSVFMQGNPELLISSHTPAGKIFCCAAESILCALYDLQVPLKGHINKGAVEKLLDMSIKDGYYEK